MHGDAGHDAPESDRNCQTRNSRGLAPLRHPVALVALCIIVLTHALQCAGRYRHARGAGRTHHRCCKAQSSGKCCACPALPQAFRPISSCIRKRRRRTASTRCCSTQLPLKNASTDRTVRELQPEGAQNCARQEECPPHAWVQLNLLVQRNNRCTQS